MAKRRKVSALRFLPVSDQNWADKLIRDGRVIRGYIGIGGREIAPLHAQSGMDQLQGS